MPSENQFCYPFPRPALTVDIIVARQKGNDMEILLIQRKNPPFQNNWALPGGFVDEGETTEQAALRELQEETGITVNNLALFTVASKPGRDPRGWTVSLVYLTKIEEGHAAQAVAGDDAKSTGWYSLNSLPDLAFDHSEILFNVKNAL